MPGPWIRVRFGVAVGDYSAGLIYDVEDNDAVRKLVEGGLADILPFPEVVPSPLTETETE